MGKWFARDQGKYASFLNYGRFSYRRLQITLELYATIVILNHAQNDTQKAGPRSQLRKTEGCYPSVVHLGSSSLGLIIHLAILCSFYYR